MRCLWITRQDPRPANSGELIYSLGLLDAFVAASGAEVTVLAHEPLTPASGGPPVEWIITGPIPSGRWQALFTRWPSDPWRLGDASSRRALRQLLASRVWDWCFIDQAACAWALDEIGRAPGRVRRLAYIAHNREAEVRAQVAGESDGSWPMRLALLWDARKYAAMEDRLAAASDLVTAITPRDRDAFLRAHPGKDMVCLPPGYVGTPTDGPGVTPATPRAVVLAGAFEWLAKRRNLEAFLAAAAPVFPGAGIAFSVVGKAPPGYFESLQPRFPWCRFAANVPSVTPWLDAARIGLIPEALGGGFKLKALDYIFRRLPVAALAPAMSGLPVDPEEDALIAEDQEGLVATIAARINDIPFLSAAADRALAKCRHAFDWADRGRALANALARLGE